jgi:hypothetical protein
MGLNPPSLTVVLPPIKPGEGGFLKNMPSSFWLRNLSETEPIEVVGVYVSAGNLESPPTFSKARSRRKIRRSKVEFILATTIEVESETKGGREMKTSKGCPKVIIGIVISLVIGISDALAATDYPTRYIDYVIP